MRNLKWKIAVCGLALVIPCLAEKKVITPAEFAPKPGAPPAPYSAGILSNGTLYVAGNIGRDLKTGEVPADFDKEVQLCLDNIALILKQAHMTFADAVSVQVYLTDIDLFARMNAVYMKNFPEPRPARTTVGVAKLAAPKARIEITVTASK